MTTTELELRVAALEKRVDDLAAKNTPSTNKDWVLKIWGSFAGDPDFEKAMSYGRKWAQIRERPIIKGHQEGTSSESPQMIILDTDILSIAQRPETPDALVLQRHIVSLSPDVTVATTIISYDEQTRGWFDYFSKAKTSSDVVKAYFKLLKHVNDWRNVNVVPFDQNASAVFDSLRRRKIRVGTPDLRIAAVALSLNATLITRNLHDFTKVPNLRAEDWTKA